jgi:t-SNARE complex subunit (syntaxin)
MPSQSLALMTQDRYLEDRAETVATITRTISELQNIFTTFSTLVAEQQEMIER